MNWFDYVVLGVLVVSVAWSVLRGVVREIVSLGGWIIAFLAANLFAGPLARFVPQAVPGESLRMLVAFLAVFLGVLVLSALVGLIMSRLVRAVGLGTADRVLGALFGLARGILVVMAATLLAGLTSAPAQPFWRDRKSTRLNSSHT